MQDSPLRIRTRIKFVWEYQQERPQKEQLQLPTHQGPSPRFGIVVGAIIPLTSCWIILKDKTRIMSELASTNSQPRNRTRKEWPNTVTSEGKGKTPRSNRMP